MTQKGLVGLFCFINLFDISRDTYRGFRTGCPETSSTLVRYKFKYWTLPFDNRSPISHIKSSTTLAYQPIYLNKTTLSNLEDRIN